MYDHGELVDNWDKVDAIFGGPQTGVWPDGGVYTEIQKARDGAIPLGMLFPWYRPSLVVPIPTGYVVADGSTLAAIDHSFPGGGNVTIPDLRNRFVLGADYNKEIEADAADASNPLANSAEGAPGPQATGGLNAVALTEAELPKHTHTGSLTGWSPALATWYYQGSTYGVQPQPMHPESENFESVRWGTGVHWSAGNGGFVFGQHRHSLASISATGSDEVHENRPRYIGLIWLIKVKNSG